jgi:IclR family mhp operon transcriptional activator
MDRARGVHTIGKALAVLEALNGSCVTPLAELHSLTGIPKSSLVRLLDSLIAAGYVTRISRRDGYSLTGEVLRLSAGVRPGDAAASLARPLMEAFTHRHRWQVSFATSEGETMRVRFTTRHISPFSREENFLNRPVSMLRSAVGRAYFAFCSAEERRLVLRVLQNDGEATPREHIERMAEAVRACGYATIRRPSSSATQSFAVPVLDPEAEDSPLGALALFYYRRAFGPAEALERYLAPLRDLARDIGEAVAQTRAPASLRDRRAGDLESVRLGLSQ